MVDRDIYFAVVGDVHGDIYTMLGLLQNWTIKHQQSISFVLQVGDFEPHRNLDDLATMDAPTKYKKMGDFADFYTGKAFFPYPLYFIGGNHEPYGFLDYFVAGKEIAPNFNYLGRVNLIELAGLKIVGVSGIYKPNLFTQALNYNLADILIMHEWATDIISPEDFTRLQQRYSGARYDLVGNEYARLLIEALQPKLVVFGHMHFRYTCSLTTANGIVSNICCFVNYFFSPNSLISNH